MKRSKYTVVYRLEHPSDRNGPYRGCYTSDVTIAMFDKTSTWVSNKHPIPTKDGIRGSVMYEKNVYCGCKSMKQLREWFGEFLKPLIEDGFELVKFYVPRKNVYYGKHQVVFERSESPLQVIVKKL